jgi:hypothetical protein
MVSELTLISVDCGLEQTKDYEIHNCCFSAKAKKKSMCVYCHMSKKSRVGRSALIIIFFLTIVKTRNSRSRFRNPIPVFHFRNFR